MIASGGVAIILTSLRASICDIVRDSLLEHRGKPPDEFEGQFVVGACLGRDPEIDNIVKCIIGLARALHMAMHMQVTAEGVETEDQRRILQKMGCDELQGYLLSRPVTPGRLREVLDEGSARTEAGGLKPRSPGYATAGNLRPAHANMADAGTRALR